jgi:F-box and WD-40 domain protein MET30
MTVPSKSGICKFGVRMCNWNSELILSYSDSRRCLKTISGHVGQVQQVVTLPPEFDLDVESYVADQDEDTETDNDQELDDSSSDDPHVNGHLQNHHAKTERPRKGTPTPLINAPFFPDQPDRPNPPQYMLTGSLDNTLRLWHVPSGRCLRKFFGHVEGVWALAADTLRVVSGAEDRMIKTWGWDGKCESTYTGHTGPVTCIGLSGERLISGGEDCEVRVLEFDTDRPDCCLQTVEE